MPYSRPHPTVPAYIGEFLQEQVVLEHGEDALPPAPECPCGLAPNTDDVSPGAERRLPQFEGEPPVFPVLQKHPGNDGTFNNVGQVLWKVRAIFPTAAL